MTVFVFGNPDVPMDSLPLRLVPKLRQAFPDAIINIKDPNEEWGVPERLLVIDTVKGIDRVQEFHGLETFTRAPRVSMHDFDALTQLRLMQKLGKLKEVVIIGVPPDITESSAFQAVKAMMQTINTATDIVGTAVK